MAPSVVFCFVVSNEGIAVDSEKVKAIIDWPVPTNLKEVHNFRELTSFYRQFIRGFSFIMAPPSLIA